MEGKEIILTDFAGKKGGSFETIFEMIAASENE